MGERESAHDGVHPRRLRVERVTHNDPHVIRYFEVYTPRVARFDGSSISSISSIKSISSSVSTRSISTVVSVVSIASILSVVSVVPAVSAVSAVSVDEFLGNVQSHKSTAVFLLFFQINNNLHKYERNS